MSQEVVRSAIVSLEHMVKGQSALVIGIVSVCYWVSSETVNI